MHRTSSCDKRCVTIINILPDDVLLYIFRFDGLEDVGRVAPQSWKWLRLVHVCRRWRSLAFASQNFLGLRLVLGPWTRVELLGVWPTLPITITDKGGCPMPSYYDFNAAIVHRNRISEINLRLTRSQLRRLASAMQEQFSALKRLALGCSDHATALPDGLLGGFAPSLQSLELESIPFPALPKFLLSATDLVNLRLLDIPHSKYISPEVVVTSLSTLTRLEKLCLVFRSPSSFPDPESQRPPLTTCTVLPALTRFQFEGTSEYLEDLVARIDAPLLDYTYITVFRQPVLDISQLSQFMRRTTKFDALNEAHVYFDYYGVRVCSLPPKRIFDDEPGLRFLCLWDWRLSSLAKVFTSSFPSIFMVEHLYIHEYGIMSQKWRNGSENIEWLKVLYPFIAVKNLYLSKLLAPQIAFALKELVGDRATRVLPTLQNIFLSGPQQEGIAKFVAARQLSDYPITVSHWEKEAGIERRSLIDKCPH